MKNLTFKFLYFYFFLTSVIKVEKIEFTNLLTALYRIKAILMFFPGFTKSEAIIVKTRIYTFIRSLFRRGIKTCCALDNFYRCC